VQCFRLGGQKSVFSAVSADINIKIRRILGMEKDLFIPVIKIFCFI